MKSVLYKPHLDLYAVRNDFLPFEQAAPDPLRDLQPGDLIIFRLQEVVQAPAEVLVIKQLALLRLRLQDDGL